SECESMVSEFSDIDESVKENSIVFGLKVGDELDNWDAAERQVQNHAMEVGFELKINLNLSDGAVYITLLNNEHNHLLYKNIKDILLKHHCLNPEMLNQVEFLVNIGYEAGMIICGLQKNFPNAIIYSKNVYNAIYLFKRNKQLVKTDAFETYKRLMQLQCEETEVPYFTNIKAQHHQMNKSLLYRAKEIKDWKLLIDSQDYNLEDNNKSKNVVAKFVKDDYESNQEDELNTLLLDWIKEKKTEIYDKQLDHEISISNPYQVYTKGARKKHLKSALDDISNAIANKQCNSKTDKDIGSQGKYVCSNCKSTRHNT
ncbi:29957_t:CDS:2, partial [Gigaspora margarita]